MLSLIDLPPGPYLRYTQPSLVITDPATTLLRILPTLALWDNVDDPTVWLGGNGTQYFAVYCSRQSVGTQKNHDAWILSTVTEFARAHPFNVNLHTRGRFPLALEPPPTGELICRSNGQEPK